MKLQLFHIFKTLKKHGPRKRHATRLLTLTCMLLVMGAITIRGYANDKIHDFTVVIDAGHGGHDHGAIDNGVREKDINLGVATKLASMIRKKMKDVHIVMTREDDTFISLQERANIANRNKGDLFISIHTNSVDKGNPNRSKIAGASVYALGSQKSADNLRVARRENAVIELERDYHQKYSGFDPSKDESYIIFEMAQKKTIGQSLRFADKAQKELVKAGRNDRGVRQAGFWVLWATSMPAVLVELDFICNPEAAAYLNSSKGQEKLATALFNALEQYLASNKKTAVNSIDLINQGSNGADPKIARNEFTSATYYEEAVAIASTDNEVIPTVPRVTSEKRVKTHNPGTAGAKKQTYGPRKRRSQASREASSKRNVETDQILVRNETDYLVREEEPVEQKVVEKPKSEDTKGKKKKKKEKKPKTPKKPKEKNNNSKKNSKTRTFIVSGSASGGVSNPIVSQPQKKIYKILLLSSSKELDYSDPQFHGLRPTGMFRENNLYKYTVGASESRKEIEAKLNDIRSILPGASIVVRME